MHPSKGGRSVKEGWKKVGRRVKNADRREKKIEGG